MERLTKDMQSIKAQLTDIKQKYEYIISVLQDKDIIQSQQKKEALLNKKRKQLNYPFFAETLETLIPKDFKGCDKINLLIRELHSDEIKWKSSYTYKIVSIRFINSIELISQTIVSDIDIDFEVQDLEDEEYDVNKVFNILLRRMDKNKYAYLDGSLKIIE